MKPNKKENITAQFKTNQTRYFTGALTKTKITGTNVLNAKLTMIYSFINHTSNMDSLQKHKSESTFTGWRHRTLRHCSRSTTRGHASSIPLYHLPRLRA